MSNAIHVLQYLSTIGQLEVDYPPPFVSFTTLFAWSTGLFVLPFDDRPITFQDDVIDPGFENYLNLAGLRLSNLLENTLFNFSLLAVCGIFCVFVFQYAHGNWKLQDLARVESISLIVSRFAFWNRRKRTENSLNRLVKSCGGTIYSSKDSI